MSFLAWKVWINKIPVTTLMTQWNSNISPMCKCCEVLMRETVENLFLKEETTCTIWSYFANAAGLLGPWIQVKQVMMKWWDTKGNTRHKLVCQAIPNVILWFIWRRRNELLHGGTYSTVR